MRRESKQTASGSAGLGAPDDLGFLDQARAAFGVGLSRYIMPNVSVGVRTGAKPTDSAATMSVDVTKKVRVQGEAGADGSATAGVAVQWDY
jgi:translocation and assembly module TamB